MKQRKGKWQLAAVLTVMLLVLGMAFSVQAADSTDLVYGQNGKITRAQWLHDVVTVFELTVDEENLPDQYYQDMTEDAQYYQDMMSAVEFGIINIPSGESIYPEKNATREFAADTLNHCLGLQSEKSGYTFSDSADVTNPDNAQIALDQGWMELKNGKFCPDEEVTETEVRAMLKNAAELRKTEDINEDHDDKFIFEDGVKVVSQDTSVYVDENNVVTIYDTSVDISEGDTFAVYMNGLPGTYVAKKVTREGDHITITTSDSGNVVKEIDAEGIAEVDLSTVEPAEGMTATYFKGGTEAAGYTDGVPYSAREVQGSKDVNATKLEGTLRAKNGSYVSITGMLSDTYVKYSIKSQNHEAYVTLNGRLMFEMTVYGNIKDLEGFPTSVDLGSVDILGIGRVRVYGKVELTGKATCTYTERFTIGVKHSDSSGTRYIRKFTKENFSLVAVVDMDLSLGVEASFNILDMVTGSVTGTIGIRTNYKYHDFQDGTKPDRCATFLGWVYANTQTKLKVDYGDKDKKIDFNRKEVIFDFDNSPVRVIYHWEDEKRVPRCTRNLSDVWYIQGYKSKYGKTGDGNDYYDENQKKFVPVFTYEVYKNSNNNEVAAITGYTGTAYALVIPEEIDGYKVEKIRYGAFKGRNDITTVVVPDSVVEIESNSFFECRSLSSVKLSSNLKTLSYGAFYNCDKLTSIIIPKSLEKATGTTSAISGDGPFSECDNLKNITFEAGTTRIAEHLFGNCKGLERIEIPDTVQSIGYEAFYKCGSLTDVKIGSGVTEIAYAAFEYCDKLAEIVIPNSVVEIGTNSFYECKSLSSVKLSSNLKTLSYGAFYNCDKLTSIIIPKSLEKATGTTSAISGDGPFSECDNLKNITFEAGTTRIAEHLFGNCKGLERIEIPDTVQSIGYEAFYKCGSLTDVKIGSEVTKIGYGAFEDCGKLAEIIIPKKVKSLGEYCFEACSSLKEIDISQTGITAIEKSTFAECSRLKNIKFPTALSEFEEEAFYKCTSLESIELPADTIRIGVSAFRESGLKNIVIPENVTQIRYYAFQNTPLETVTFKDSAAEIWIGAFENCDKLTTVNFGKNIRTIGNQAFYDCDELASITIPDSVTSIGTSIFEGCDKLSEVSLGTGIETISQKAFFGCPSLQKFIVPYSVTKIDAQAFGNCTKLTEISIPQQTVTIADNAFSYPAQLTIYGVSGSYAETYANQKEIKFVNREVKPEKVELSSTELTINNGTSTKLNVSVTPADFTANVGWKSSNTDVVTVDSKGKIQARSVGSAIVKVSAGSVSASCKITVVQPVTRISLNRSSVSMNAGETFQLTASVQPSTANNKEITWSSDTPETATVSENGLVTALKKGTAVITAEAQDGSGVKETSKITVQNNLYVVTDPTQMESAHNYEDNCSDIWMYTYPSDAEALLVTFDQQTNIEEGFGDALYIYDGDGTEIGKYEGTALAGKTVTVPGKTVKLQLISDDSGNEWGFKVTRIEAKGEEPAPKEDQVLAGTDAYTKVYKDPVFTLDTRLTTGNGTLSWTSDNTAVAEVNQNGDVTITGTGTAVITVTASETAEYNSATKTILITVNKAGRSFHPSVVAAMKVGETAQIHAGTEETVLYTADHPEIAEVAASGLVTAKAEGNVVITAVIPETQNYKEARAELKIRVTTETVVPAIDLNDCEIEVIGEGAIIYDGTPKEPEVKVSYNGTEYVRDLDYSLTYRNNTEAGTGVIIITALADRELVGVREVTFTIREKVNEDETEIGDHAFFGSDMKQLDIGAKIRKIGDYAFGNCSQLQLIRFHGNAPEIAASSFADVTAVVLVPVDDKTWTAEKRQNYGGNLTWKFWDPQTEKVYENIENMDVSLDLSFPAFIEEYYGHEHTPEVIIKTADGKKLKEYTDFTVEYRNNLYPGTASANITGIGNYRGSVVRTFVITKGSSYIYFVKYEVKKPIGAVFINELDGEIETDGEITYRSSNEKVATVNSKTGQVTAKGVGTTVITVSVSEGKYYNANEGSYTLTVVRPYNTIQASNVNRTVSSKTQTFYIGAKAKGGAKLTYKSDNKKITVNSKGKITIAKNYAGKAEITIKAASTTKYSAVTKKITVTVAPKGTTISKCTNVKGKKAQIQWKKGSSVTGYQIEYSTDKNFKKGVTRKTISKSSTVKYTASKLTNKKTYYVRIRTYKKDRKATAYSSWSKSKSVKITK